MRIRERLEELGLELPPAFDYPSRNRTGCVTTRGLLYTSGHPPPENCGVKVRGKVGGDVSEDEAYQSARATALSILASVENELGSLDRITQVVKVTGMVNQLNIKGKGVVQWSVLNAEGKLCEMTLPAHHIPSVK